MSKANFIPEQIENLGPTTTPVVVVCECGYLKKE
jgi:hypothetical protein